ncbi:hypothetical protein ABZ897_38135 [Nonomuraea sp. NPDC046802]|uniref:hypothetical protein n=1 Tax=Nonomuraea sp. NPDC046802 TaxID=3154919 RepID=UPI0033DBFA8A
MNDPYAGPANIANDSAMVAVQTEAIHGDVTVYQVSPGASPEETFEVGVRALSGGMAPQAREHLREAVSKGYVTSRSCFYLLLALLSGRTLQQVPPEEIATLRFVRGRIKELAGDEWTDAIKLINRLLTSRSAEAGDAPAIEHEFKELGDKQREEILQHLEMFLHTSVKDTVWARAVESAMNDRCGGERLGRIWKFFQPEPADAWVQPTRPVEIENGLIPVIATPVSLVFFGFVGVAAWQHSWPSAAFALLLLAAGCCTSVRSGVEWRFRNERRLEKDLRHQTMGRSATTGSSASGFAEQVDRDFDHYFARYTPRHADKTQWLAETAGIRNTLRNEVVNLYRESTFSAKQVAWLVRYLVSDVARRWQAGTLRDYRNELRVAASTKAQSILGAAVAAVGAALLVWGGTHVRSFTIPFTAIAVITGWGAFRCWLDIAVEYKRHEADKAEEHRLLADRTAALDRWRRKLNENLPDDREMAHWLDCDRKALMEEAMRHYRLKPHDVLAHAFIEAPAASYRRARVLKGPWRYSRYKLLIFLLTKDGVRQVTVDLDFQRATFHNRGRINYRYDAVAAVQVAETDGEQILFELTLVNGDPIKVKVTGPPSKVAGDENSESVSKATLGTTGLGNTLHILEGIAAEGKEWIDHEKRRERSTLADLTGAVDAFFA